MWNFHLHLEWHRASTVHKCLNHILWEKHSIKECESPSKMDMYLPFSILLFEWGPQKARNFCGTIQFRSPFSTLWSKENKGTHKIQYSYYREHRVHRGWRLPYAPVLNLLIVTSDGTKLGTIINIKIFTLTLILPHSRMGTVWFYTSTSNKRAAWPKLYTKSLTKDSKRMYSRLTLVRISIKL